MGRNDQLLMNLFLQKMSKLNLNGPVLVLTRQLVSTALRSLMITEKIVFCTCMNKVCVFRKQHHC